MMRPVEAPAAGISAGSRCRRAIILGSSGNDRLASMARAFSEIDKTPCRDV